MQIWVDADACPVAIKEILFRAAQRTATPVILVANHFMRVPNSAYISFRQVEQGFDVADNYIVQQAQAGDLVITADIPLADEVISQGCLVLAPRGEELTKANIKARLNMRDFMETLRSSGMAKGGPPPLSGSEKQAFGNALDRWLAKHTKAM